MSTPVHAGPAREDAGRWAALLSHDPTGITLFDEFGPDSTELKPNELGDEPVHHSRLGIGSQPSWPSGADPNGVRAPTIGSGWRLRELGSPAPAASRRGTWHFR